MEINNSLEVVSPVIYPAPAPPVQETKNAPSETVDPVQPETREEGLGSVLDILA